MTDFNCHYFFHALQTFLSKLYLVENLLASVRMSLPPSDRPNIFHMNVFCRIVNTRSEISSGAKPFSVKLGNVFPLCMKMLIFVFKTAQS